MNHILDHASPDHAIDKVLTGLRNTPPPVGLGARIHQRLASQATHLSAQRQRFHLQPRFAFAAVLALLALASLATLHRQRQPPIAQAFRLASDGPSSQSFLYRDGTDSVISTETKRLHHLARRRDPCILSTGTADCTLRENPLGSDGGENPDTIALAETLAPSNPAPPLPLTEQEVLLLRSTRPGQPIEIAELETRRESVLTERAAAREQAIVREYIQGLLGPLATAETFTTSHSPSDDSQPVSDSEPPLSQ